MSAASEFLRSTAKSVAPETTRYLAEFRYLWRETASLRRELDKAPFESAVASVLAHPGFRAEQIPSEILELLRTLQALKPVRVCEIGARRGGTLALFALAAAPNARILSMDIAFSHARTLLNPRLGRPTQTVACWKADSHDPSLPSKVSAWFGDKLDFLFIDGDHSYDGVRMDYERFSPMVRAGGLIAFHDISPDSLTRGHGKSASDSGGVPRFWAELKQQNPQAIDVIDDPLQDGFGLGLITVN
ncbi:MAG: class I SAM-dependent methyltransferase [Vicinamibacteria bacterium]